MNELFTYPDTLDIHKLCALDLRSVKYRDGTDEDLVPGMRVHYESLPESNISLWKICHHSPYPHPDHNCSLSTRSYIPGRMYPLTVKNLKPSLSSWHYIRMAKIHVEQSKGKIPDVSSFLNPNLFGFLLMRSIDHKHMTGDKIKIQEIPLGILNHVGITSHTELHEMINQTKNAVENLFNTIN